MSESRVYLEYEGDILYLKNSEGLKTCIDWGSGPFQKRLISLGKRQPLPKAIGIAKGIKKVFDATAGFGTDMMSLAHLGCEVTACEQNELVFKLLEDALGRTETGSIRLIHGSAQEILMHLPKNDRPEAVYLDPMYPIKEKSALPKKEMLLLQELLGESDDLGPLFNAAYEVATNRVVIKRPHRAETMREDLLSHAIEGKLVRFDVYMKHEEY